MSNSPRTLSPRPGNSSPRQPAISIAPPPPPLPAAAATSGASTTNALTLLLQQALAKGDLSKSLESMSSLLSLSGDNRLKADLLLKLIDLTRHFQSLIVAAPLHTAPLLKCLRLLLIDKEPTLRSQSLRVLRYLLTDWEMVHQMLLVNLDLMIVRSLERESKFLWERMQALKLIRKWMAMLATAQARIRDPLSTPPLAKGLPNRPPIGLTRSLVQSLVSIAEQPKDDFRRVCLDAIRELTLLSPAIVASCNGIRTLVDSILDPACVDIANSLTLTLLYLIDSETTRGFLRPSVDLVRLISVFTDTTAADNPERENRRAAAHKALVMLMRSWTGILVLTSDPQCLRALIGMLNLPASIKGSSWARETIFDLLFEIVHVVKAQDVRETAQRIRCSMSAASGGVTHAYPPNLLHSYMVMLLLSFLACDLVDILTQLALSQDAEFASVASKLLGEILGLSAELLPREVTKKLNSMRGVIASAAAFDSTEENSTSSGTSAFIGASGSSSAQQANADKSDETATISHRHRAVHVLSSLAHSELHSLGPLALAGYGSGNASAASNAAPGTGWAWTGALGVHWEAVHAHQRELARLDAAGQGRRDSHEWNMIESRGPSSLVRNTSFSRSGGMSGSGGPDSFVEHTPTGRRAVLHGIRLERLALRCDLAVNPARLVSSGAYGGSNAGTAEAALAPATCLSSTSALASRNRMLHRLAISSRSSAAINAHGGTHVPTSALLTYQPSDFHTEEADLAPLLKKSQVLSTKEFRAWEWEYIHLIIEKFMSTSPTHTAYLVLKTKFPKRLLSFLRSDKKHFVELEWQVFHLRFVRMGVGLLKAMLGCQEGREYSWFIEFIDSLFLSLLWEISSTDGRKDTQIMGGTGVEKYEGVGSHGTAGGAKPSSATSTTASVESSAFTSGRRLSHLSSGLAKSKAKIFQAMSRQAVQSRLIREYFTFLSILSSSVHGVAYFEKYGFFDCISHLARDPSKDYLTKLFLSSVNLFFGPMATGAGAGGGAAGAGAGGRSLIGGWRRIIEGWLAVPPPGSAASGQPGKEGCNVYLRLHAVDVFLIAFRRHQSSQGSQSAAQETDLHGCGILGSHPTSSVSAIVSSAALSNPASVQCAQGDAMGATEWILGILLQQLQCLDHHLRSAVLHALEEICLVSPTALHALIARRPVILKDLARQTKGHAIGASGTGGPSSLLYPVAHRLLVLFLSSRSGLEFLRSSSSGGGLGFGVQPNQSAESWLDQQLAQWKHVAGSSESSDGGCTTYVRGLEEALVSALSATNKDEPSEHGEEGLTTAAGSAAAAQQAQAGASKLDELSAPPAPPSSVSSAWSGPPLRSALDEHVSAVIHNLPWVVDVTVEHPQGRTVQVMTECWVVTTAHAPVSSTPTITEPTAKPSSAQPHMTRAPSSSEDLGQTFSAASTTSASADAMAHALAPMTYLVCQVLDLEGFPRPLKLESNVTLRARISIGAGVHSLNVQDMFSHSTGQNTPATPSAAESRQGGRSVHSNYRGGHGNDRGEHAGGFRGVVDTAATFQEEREIERDWSRTFFPDHSGHASEYVCRPRDREKIHPEQPWLASVNASELCEEDEARWHFEVPDSSLPAPFTHSSVRGPTAGSSPSGATTLESIWFPLPLMPASPPSVVLLPHFYGELARTDEGVRVLASTGQIREMERSIREGGLSGCENDVGLQAGKQPSATAAEVAGFMNIPSAASALEKRAALWAVGHIGSTAPGFQLLNQQAPGLVQYISQQSVSCTTLSMRGTCFYILGLLGRSSLGRTYLSGLGWSFSPFPGACIALPSVVSLGGTTDAWHKGEMGGDAVGGEEGREEEIARRLAEELEDDDDDSIPSTGARMQIIPASTTVTSSLRASPLSGFLRLDWPSSSYRGSWALDPANIFGINSSKRTRKVGGVDQPAGGEGEKTVATTTAQKDDANEVLSSTEGIEVILSHLSNLCNHVTQKNSLQALRTMKAQPHHAHFFTSPLLLFETYKLLQTYNYKLPARRFLFFDLFGSVAFNMHTIAPFDQVFAAPNLCSAQKLKHPPPPTEKKESTTAGGAVAATGALTPR